VRSRLHAVLLHAGERRPGVKESQQQADRLRAEPAARWTSLLYCTLDTEAFACVLSWVEI